MAESPITLKQLDAGNGKRKLVIREREYDAFSWYGLRIIMSVLVAAICTTATVLAAYYSAEAAQNEQLSTHTQQIADVKQQWVDRRTTIDNVLTKIDNTLMEQYKVIRDTGDRLIEVQTTQKMMKESFDEVAKDVKNFRK
jgi:archaellum component FlaC